MIKETSPRGSSNLVKEEQEEKIVHSSKWWDKIWQVVHLQAIVDQKRLIKMHTRSWLINKLWKRKRLSNHNLILLEQVWCHHKRWEVICLVKWVDKIKVKTWTNSTNNSPRCLTSSKNQRREKWIVVPQIGEEANSMMTMMTTSICQSSFSMSLKILVISTVSL